MAVQVDAVRARLVEWRAVDERARVRAGAGARAARVCLLSLVPLILVVRASLDVSTLSRTLSQPVALVAIATLTLVGSAWAWRVTTPPCALIRRPSALSRGEPIRGRLASELLAVLLSLDVPASQAQRRACAQFHLTSEELHETDVDEALGAVDERRRDAWQDAVGASADAALLWVVPLVTCLLPAAILAALL